MHKQFLLPPAFDYSATFLWAITGALLGAKRGYAILGIITIALVSSTGGGLLRDGLFLRDGPPVLLRTPVYLLIIAAAVLLVVFFGRWLNQAPYGAHLVGVVDAIGLGAYAVVGMNRALAAQISLPGVVLVGMVNAVGGGILRDILIGEEPHMFQPGTLEESSALIGCLLFIAVTQTLSVGQFMASWLTIGVTFSIRTAAIRFGIQSRPLKAFSDYWTKLGVR